MDEILQNAIYIKSQDKYYLSRNRHDFVAYKIGKYEGFIDGGKDYFRASVLPNELKDDVVHFHLMEKSPKKLIREKLLWGSYGVKGNEPLTYRPLISLEKSHLKAILKMDTISKIYRDTIQSILKSKKK